MDLTRLQEILKNKRLLVIGGIGMLVLIVLVAQFLGTAGKRTASQPETGVPSERDMAEETKELIQESQSLQGNKKTVPATPAQSAALQKAIDEAKQASKEYDSWKDKTWEKYPWIKKLPIVGEKYYAYFDLDKEKFIGKLYPKTGDNTEQLKEAVKKELKEGKGIPVENFNFEWQIIPK